MPEYPGNLSVQPVPKTVHYMADHVFSAACKDFDQIWLHEDIQFMAAAVFGDGGCQGGSGDIPENAASVRFQSTVFDPYPVTADFQAFAFGKRSLNAQGEAG